jgi:hypothetical protein
MCLAECHRHPQIERETMNLEMIFKDASKDEDAGQYVLLDDNRDFLGQFHTIEELMECVKNHQIKCPAIYDIDLLKDQSYILAGDQVHVF